MTKAIYSGRASASVKGQEVKSKNIEGAKTINLEQGDGKASVSQTRGFKHWMSADDRDNHVGRGMSVEASVSVTLTCDQSKQGVLGAAEAAGIMAEDVAHAAIEEMDQYLFAFMEDSK